MNVNQIKHKLRKIKISIWYKNIDEIILTALKETFTLYVYGAGLKNNQQNKNEDKSMKSFPKTSYCRTLVTNAESVYKTTNPHFKNPCAPSFAETKQGFYGLKKPTWFSIPVFTATYKNIKKFVSEMSKRTTSRGRYQELIKL